jgi:hypothetical protein
MVRIGRLARPKIRAMDGAAGGPIGQNVPQQPMERTIAMKRLAIALVCMMTGLAAASAIAQTPAIHMPGQYAAITGRPFMLDIAATGSGPMSFAVDGLPGGLSIDSATGVISGTAAKDGTYDVKVTVTDAAGSATAVVPIVVGSTLALTPPMGWNSYDGYGDNVTEDEILANAKAVETYLRPHGWQYVVVDYRWYDPGAHDNNAAGRAGADLTMDANGRLLPSPNRFPSAVKGAGFKPLADKIHTMGLRFGIHIMRGIPQNAVKANLPIEGSDFKAADAADTASVCAWCKDMYGVKGDTGAGAAWYDSIFRQYAAWGVDYIKVDDLSRPYAAAEIKTIHDAINKSGRAIVFSTSPGATPLNQAGHVMANANLWRITDDFWDRWALLNPVFDTAASWLPSAGPGHWPDADMLPLGHLSVGHRSVGNDRQSGFTQAEQTTMMTLWSLMPSPLMLGGDFTRADAWELSLLTNDEVLAIDQDPSGKAATRVAAATADRAARGAATSASGTEAWCKTLSDGSIAIGLFNRSTAAADIGVTLAQLGLKGNYHVVDVWTHKALADTSDRLTANIASHGAVLLKLTAAAE